MNDNQPNEILQAIAALRDEVAALRQQLAGSIETNKRIEPDALYSVREATEKISISPGSLREKLRARIVVAKGGSKGRPWQIRGSELLKLGGTR